MKRTNIIAELMAEQCIYGGLLATRGEVYRDLQECRGRNDERLNCLAIDRFVWMCKPVSPEDAAELLRHGMTLKAIRSEDRTAAR